jgi:hypothetical protein
MSQFMIWSRIEMRQGGRFVAIASAIPCSAGQHSAPEQRTLECDSRNGAEAAAGRLARALIDEMHARRRRLAGVPQAAPVSPFY